MWPPRSTLASGFTWLVWMNIFQIAPKQSSNIQSNITVSGLWPLIEISFFESLSYDRPLGTGDGPCYWFYVILTEWSSNLGSFCPLEANLGAPSCTTLGLAIPLCEDDLDTPAQVVIFKGEFACLPGHRGQEQEVDLTNYTKRSNTIRAAGAMPFFLPL